jgi:amino acid transporter
VLGILLVLPTEKITGIGGFVDAINETYSVYGGAQNTLFTLTVLGFIFTLMTSGAVWMIGADRVLAVSAYDGSFFPWFGVFNEKLGTPVRCNMLSGIVSSLFMIAAVLMLKSSSAADAFLVVLALATSTTLISYLWIFPSALKLRYAEPHVQRRYRVPGDGNVLMWVLVAMVTAWTALGSWVAVFPGTLEPLFGVSYDFADTWGVSRLAFHGLTLGTLIIMFVVAILGYLSGKAVRERDVVIPIEHDTAAATPA